MTTINNKEIPAHYRSIENLPDIIKEMEQHGDCSDRDGNLDRSSSLEG